MTDSPLTHEPIAEIVRHVEPTWDLRTATPAAEGAHLVYHLDIGTEAGARECVLKATPPGRDPTCGEEARLLAVLDTHTDLRVPAVIGVVDDHEEWPTPLFLSSTLPGANYNRTDLSEFDAEAVETLARSTGRQLAELHTLDAVEAYGFVAVDVRERLDGDRPGDDLERITVQDPIDDWRDYLDAEVDRVATALAETRFADVVPTVRSVLGDGIDDLPGPFEPVVARIDQSLDNLVVDPDTTAVTGWLDWEFCVAATPAYDLAFVEHSLAGGHWTFLPDVPDHRETIRAGLREGYRAAGRESLVEQARENVEYYTLLSEVHAMCNFESWFGDLDMADATDAEIAAAAEALRDRVSELVAGQ